MARDFPGTTGNYLSASDAPIWDLTDALSLSIWVKADDVSNYRTLMSRWEEGTNKRSWWIGNDTGLLRFDTSHDGTFVGAGNTATGGVLPIGKWSHVVCIHDPVAGVNAIYLDAVLKARTSGVTAGIFDNDLSVRIGGAVAFAGPEQNFNGLISHAALWNSVLSPSEILALTQLTSPRTIRTGSLIGYWPLDDSRAGAAKDYSVYNNSAAQTGTVPIVSNMPVAATYAVVFMPAEADIIGIGANYTDSATVKLTFTPSGIDDFGPPCLIIGEGEAMLRWTAADDALRWQAGDADLRWEALMRLGTGHC